MIGNAKQQLSRIGVERGKMEVLVWYGGARETEKDEIYYFGEWEMEEWRGSGYGGLEERAVREKR